jgi:hypothetical protein
MKRATTCQYIHYSVVAPRNTIKCHYVWWHVCPNTDVDQDFDEMCAWILSYLAAIDEWTSAHPSLSRLGSPNCSIGRNSWRWHRPFNTFPGLVLYHVLDHLLHKRAFLKDGLLITWRQIDLFSSAFTRSGTLYPSCAAMPTNYGVPSCAHWMSIFFAVALWVAA